MLALKRMFLIVVMLGIAIPAFAQTFTADRLGMNRYVRGLVSEAVSADVPDTTLNRFIYYAHRTTMMVLGRASDVDIDTIITTRGNHQYALDANAMRGSVTGVSRRIETNQGGGDVGFVEIGFDNIGKLGEGVIPNSYRIEGAHLILGTKPAGSDTLFIYYAPIANDLDADTSDVTVAPEDFDIVATLVKARVYFRVGQTALGQTFLGLWQQLVAIKRGGQAFPQGGAQ